MTRRPKYLKNRSNYSLEMFRSSLYLLKLWFKWPNSFQTIKFLIAWEKPQKIFYCHWNPPLWILRYTIKNMLHLNHFFIILQKHVKISVFYYIPILRYFGWREDIFCIFFRILPAYHSNGVPFWIFYVIFKTVNIYIYTLRTQVKITGI